MATATLPDEALRQEHRVLTRDGSRSSARVAPALDHAETTAQQRLDARQRVTPNLRPIIAFSKDWHEDPTSNHHVLRELAKTRKVLWLNSLGTRKPSLGSTRDVGKIKRKLTEFIKGPVNVENDLWVMSPLVLPMPHSPIARAINQRVLRATVAALRMALGIDKFDLWTFLPNTADYVGVLGEELSIYYCVDEWSMFSYLDRAQTVAAERELLGKVDAVFAINEPLAATKRLHNDNTFVAPHGVDHAQFSAALDPLLAIPADLGAIPGPRVGFYGTVRDWVDLELIAALARSRPDVSIVLIGQVLTDVSTLRGLPNVYLMGQRPHSELPAYCKGFDVGIIPYRIDERMEYVNPLKLREYLSAGLPVVATPVPEIKRCGAQVCIAADVEEFIAGVGAALADISTETRAARSAAMKNETWSARVADVMRVVNEINPRNEK